MCSDAAFRTQATGYGRDAEDRSQSTDFGRGAAGAAGGVGAAGFGAAELARHRDHDALGQDQYQPKQARVQESGAREHDAYVSPLAL